MILMDMGRNIYTDKDEVLEAGLQESLWKSGAALAKLDSCLYRFTAKGELYMFDISARPFFKVTMREWERDAFRKSGDTYCGDVHLLRLTDTQIAAYGPTGHGTFPMELINRW